MIYLLNMTIFHGYVIYTARLNNQRVLVLVPFLEVENQFFEGIFTMGPDHISRKSRLQASSISHGSN